MLDRLVPDEAPGPVLEERSLVGERHVEGVHVVRRAPEDVVVRGLGRELDGCAGHLGGHQRDVHGLLGDLDRLIGGQRDARREPPGAVVDDADGKAQVLAVLGALQVAVAHGQVLVPDPLEPEVGMGDPEVACARQRSRGQPPVRKRGEGRIDPAGVGVRRVGGHLPTLSSGVE